MNLIICIETHLTNTLCSETEHYIQFSLRSAMKIKETHFMSQM